MGPGLTAPARSAKEKDEQEDGKDEKVYKKISSDFPVFPSSREPLAALEMQITQEGGG